MTEHDPWATPASTAKRCEANNRGLALAAVNIGWVGAAMTVVGIAGLIFYIAVAGASRERAVYLL